MIHRYMNAVNKNISLDIEYVSVGTYYISYVLICNMCQEEYLPTDRYYISLDMKYVPTHIFYPICQEKYLPKEICAKRNIIFQ